MGTRDASTHGMGLVGLRLRIGVVDGVFGRSHAPAGEKGEAAAIGNAVYRKDAGLCVCTGRAGRERTRCGDTGAHGIVASMAAAAIDGLVFATPLRSG